MLLAVLLIFVVDFFEGPFFSFSTKTWPPEIRGGKLIGGIQGAVKTADVGASVVSVASGFLGLGSLPLVVTPDTQIAVHGKFGGMADLDRGQFVRVAYEVLPDRLLAWRVDVLDRGAQSSEAPISAETERDAATDEPAPKPAAPAGTSEAPVIPAAPVPPTPTPAVERAPASTPSPISAAATPAAKRTAVAPSSSPRTSTPEPARPVPAPRPAVAPTSPQAEDGGAVIDWLIKESAGRSQ